VTKLQLGSPAPDFELPSDGGGTFRLSDLRGRNVVLYFYPKDDTTSCTQEAIDFNAVRDEFAAANTVVIGLSPDSVKSHDKFKRKYDLHFPLVSDEARTALECYGVWVEKSMYGRKYMGVERTTLLIDPDGNIVRIWPKVRVAAHVQEVLEAAQRING
jgi:thioredoxin-dependent peroxiredoxin